MDNVGLIFKLIRLFSPFKILRPNQLINRESVIHTIQLTRY